MSANNDEAHHEPHNNPDQLAADDDHDMEDTEQVEVQYVDEEVIDALDEDHYGEEDPNDFETFNEEEFAEGDEYEEG